MTSLQEMIFFFIPYKGFGVYWGGMFLRVWVPKLHPDPLDYSWSLHLMLPIVSIASRVSKKVTIAIFGHPVPKCWSLRTGLWSAVRPCHSWNNQLLLSVMSDGLFLLPVVFRSTYFPLGSGLKINHSRDSARLATSLWYLALSLIWPELISE